MGDQTAVESVIDEKLGRRLFVCAISPGPGTCGYVGSAIAVRCLICDEWVKRGDFRCRLTDHRAAHYDCVPGLGVDWPKSWGPIP